MPTVLPFRKPRPDPPRDYGQAWRDGCDFGQRCANVRFFWFGTVAGAVLMTVVTLASLNYMGAIQ